MDVLKTLISAPKITTTTRIIANIGLFFIFEVIKKTDSKKPSFIAKFKK